MKKLISTEKLLKDDLKNGIFESYALVVGYKDNEWTFTSDDVNLDTYFDAASVGKVFPTSTLALKAISQGKLSLDDTLETFFPYVPNDKKDITVKQLLTHTSGILRSEFPADIAKEGRKSITEYILSQPLAFEPGKYFAYSCNAITLLGFIIEKVFGVSLDEAFRVYIVEPLGLTRSKYNIAIDEENAAICYHKESYTDYPWDDHNVRAMNGIPAGAGGIFCTAGDLRKFVKAILNKDERLYQKELFDLAEQNHTAAIEALPNYVVYGNHGLGYEYVDSKCPQANVLFPAGSVGKEGYTGQSFYCSREKNLYVILLTNATRCTVKRFGYTKYDEVCLMRTEIHKAIKKDLEI
ncbi:MAG: beta-lactamase family protein [Clostridia bacterium]|nr:beta-lactamase family protein [Clostridia bacterium]